MKPIQEVIQIVLYIKASQSERCYTFYWSFYFTGLLFLIVLYFWVKESIHRLVGWIGTEIYDLLQRAFFLVGMVFWDIKSVHRGAHSIVNNYLTFTFDTIERAYIKAEHYSYSRISLWWASTLCQSLYCVYRASYITSTL